MVDNPVLVEVTRGQYVESMHRGAIAIFDASGKSLIEIGDVTRPIFPRSAIKPFQALYLVESGALNAFDLGLEETALACASHNGESAHVDGVSAMLAKIGLGEPCLECGSQWPNLPADRAKLVKSDQKPGALFNNCSGKHAGFICATHHLGEKVEGYIKPHHPAQRELKAILETLSGYEINDPALIGTDGCAIPTYALPLTNLAHAAARFTSATNLGQSRDKAACLIHEACTAHPHLVAGSGRFDTVVMRACGSDVLVKTGAEGVYVGMIQSLGIGIALKCEDGTTRASEAMMSACLAALLKEVPEEVTRYLDASLKNRNGWDVGAVRLVDGLVSQLTKAVS